MLMVMIYALGSVSGAHLNPAVTLGVLLSGRNKIGPIDAIAYMCFQCLGGILAALLYLSIFGTAFMLKPVWQYSTGDMCGAEILYTWALVYVVLNVATASENDPNHYFGLAIGFTVVSAAITIGAISGCSLNPAVSIGTIFAAHLAHGVPAFHFSSFYIFCPFVGAICGVLSFYLVRRRVEYGEAATAPAKTRDMPPPAPQPLPMPEAASKQRAMDIRPPPPPQPEPVLKKKMSRKLSSN